MAFYQRYKDLRGSVSDHPPSLYHATRSIFGPEMNEIREILGPSNQFKVRHLFWDEMDDDASSTRSVSLKSRLQRNVLRLFHRLQVPCSRWKSKKNLLFFLRKKKKTNKQTNKQRNILHCRWRCSNSFLGL
jgi:hypothetical protein